MTTHHTAQGLASLGRHGDTMLVHMSPHEVAGLNYLAKKQGTKLTVNPDTGLPEAFSLGGFFSSLLPTFVGMAFPGGGMMPLLAGALTGAGVAAAKKENPLLGGLMGGLGGYSGSQLGTAFSAANTPTAATTLPANTYGALTQNADLATKAVEDAAIQSGMKGAANLPMDAGQKAILDNIAATRSASTIPQIGMANTFGQTASAATIPQSTGSSIFGGLKNIVTGQPGAYEAAKAAVPNLGTKLAITGGGAALGGLEPSDIYGEPVKNQSKDKYDPYATLNLGNDTGLRLVAKGGYIDGYAVGGTVTTGGLRDLYATTDTPANPQLSRDGYGVGRLENLARQQAMTQAQTMGYAMGGPVSFADGGDAMKLQDDLTPVDQSMGLTSLMPPATIPPAPGQTMPTDSVQNAASALSNTASSDSSIIAQVANNLRTDPSYQPKNPIEAAIVKQIKGTDNTQQSQGLGSLAPSQPMAPSYNPSVAMGPTYFAGMNAPRGYADGGETSLNLDRLPSLNVETGGSSYMTPDGNGLYAGRLFKEAYRQDPNINPLFKLLSRLPDDRVFTRQMARGGYLNGAGDGMSDSIPATIEGKQPARLADGEFVVPADVVSHLGNGSSKAGSKRLYAMLDKVRHARTGNKKQGKEIKPEKYMPA